MPTWLSFVAGDQSGCFESVQPTWILPLTAIIFAGAFTEFYPDYASGEPTSYARIFDWMSPFIMVTGIVGWVSYAVPDAVGITLIVVGAWDPQ